MKNTERLPNYILAILRERLPDSFSKNTKEDVIDLLPHSAIFNHWCEYQGFHNMSERIKKAHDDIFEVVESDSRSFFKGDNKRQEEKEQQKREPNGESKMDDEYDKYDEYVEHETVIVEIRDLLDAAHKNICEKHSGLDPSDIEYVDNVKFLTFRIPKKDKGEKCGLIYPADEEGGCGENGGDCVCGKSKGHSDSCECELCGEVFNLVKKKKDDKCDKTKGDCVETGESCFCRKTKGHDGTCQCPICGEEF